MKTKEPKDKHCVLQCTYTSENIHDPVSLDTPKNNIALPYTTIDIVIHDKYTLKMPKEALLLQWQKQRLAEYQPFCAGKSYALVHYIGFHSCLILTN